MAGLKFPTIAMHGLVVMRNSVLMNWGTLD